MSIAGADVEEKDYTDAEAAMEKAGVSTTTGQQRSYFGTNERHKVFLDDGISYIEHQVLNEGGRKRYLDKLNREIAIKKLTGDAVMKMQSGEDRHILLNEAIVGWNLIGPDGKELGFSKGTPGSSLSQFLEFSETEAIDRIEKDIRKHNPWLMSNMTADDIRRQIADLEEMLEIKVKEEEGKEN